MCSKPNPRHTKINLSPEARGYRKWSFILKEDGDDWEEIETNQAAEDETVFEADEKPQACIIFLVPSEVIGTDATAMYVNMDRTSWAQSQMLIEEHQISREHTWSALLLLTKHWTNLDQTDIRIRS